MTLHYRQHRDNMIGTSSFFHYLTERLRHVKEQRQALQATFAQGKAFYQLYGDWIEDPKKKKIAFEFAKLAEENWIMRRIKACRYGFLKSGMVRNIALFFLI